MSRIRAAAATFIEAGRALGALEQAKMAIAYLDECAERGLHLGPRDPVKIAEVAALRSAADFLRLRLPGLKRDAHECQLIAERLILDLEHPGEALGQRVLKVIAAARAAWSKP